MTGDERSTNGMLRWASTRFAHNIFHKIQFVFKIGLVNTLITSTKKLRSVNKIHFSNMTQCYIIIIKDYNSNVTERTSTRTTWRKATSIPVSDSNFSL